MRPHEEVGGTPTTGHTAGSPPAASRTIPPLIIAGLIVIAVLMRLNNGVRYPSMHGYDGYAHVTYVWHLLKTHTLPLPSDGWGRFHPPLHYALCAGLWTILGTLRPAQVLKLINVVFSLAGLGSAIVSYVIARGYFAGNRLLCFLATAFVLFLPVHIYTAPMFGNETLTGLLGSLTLLLLLRAIQTERLGFAVATGVALGLGLLTKFTAIVNVAVAGAVLALWTLRTRRWRTGCTRLAIMLLVASAVSGWFYARNVRLYGNPFQMSRDYFVTHRIEHSQATGQRGLSAYLTLDPHIFSEPWYRSGSVVDSVWAGAYASTWFDAFGNWFLPYNQTTRAIGRALLVLGIVPTLLVVLGIGTAVVRLLRRGWDDTLVVMLVAICMMLAMFVVYTHENRIMSAVKASYMLPAIVPFGFCFALGTATVAAHARKAMPLIWTNLLLLVALIIPVYTYQLLFQVVIGPHYWNALATIDYFAGFHEQARDRFSLIAERDNLYLAHENRSSIAFEDGDLETARRELRAALRWLPRQAIAGLPEDRATFLRLTRAEYYNSLAVVYDGLQQPAAALRAARLAVRLDPTLPEGQFDLAILLLKRSAAAAAIAPLRQAAALDPGFAEAAVLLGVAQQQAGDCPAAIATLRRSAATRDWPRRTYPHAVGTGDLHDAAIARRRHITDLPARMLPTAALAACADGER